MSLKANLVRTEAARVYRCCSIKDENMWKHIEKLTSNFISSGYPKNFVSSNIMEGIKTATKTGKSTEDRGDNNSHVLKLPYIDEVFTRMVRKALKKADLNNVRVVTTAGRSVKSMIKRPKSQLIKSMVYIGELVIL